MGLVSSELLPHAPGSLLRGEENIPKEFSKLDTRLVQAAMVFLCGHNRQSFREVPREQVGPLRETALCDCESSVSPSPMDPQQRLNHLITKFPGDFDALWQEYSKLCKRAGVEEQPFKTDASLYNAPLITVCPYHPM